MLRIKHGVLHNPGADVHAENHTNAHIPAFNCSAQPLLLLNRPTNHSRPSDPHCAAAKLRPPRCRKSAFEPPTNPTEPFVQRDRGCYLFRHGLFELVVEQALVDFAFSCLNLRRRDTYDKALVRDTAGSPTLDSIHRRPLLTCWQNLSRSSRQEK